MNSSEFVHLHVHTQYSLLDGACILEKLVSTAGQLGMKALAITDHGNLFGAIEFYNLCRDNGIKPLIGIEAYVAPHSRLEKNQTMKDSEETNNHLLLMACDNEGYSNLIKLVTSSYLEGFYYRPRIDKGLLKEHSRGLICMTACLKGKVPRFILQGNINEAYKEADELKHIFGKDRLYIEIMDHDIDEQKKVNEGLLKISKDLDIPIVATNDVHYLHRDDAFAHEVLMSIQTQTKIDDPSRMRLSTPEFYLKSAEQMREIFKDYPEAIANTVKIAGMCNVEFDFDTIHLPGFSLPEGKTADQYLEELCVEGLKERFKEGAPQEVKERLGTELGMIKDMGYAGYFLIVQDLIRYAKNNSIIVGPGRGSAAGSIVSYLLDITELNPLSYGLLFERFLNPQRVSMPDIDIDFCYDKRPQVIEYVANKYGRQNVAQIITFGTMQARAVVRDVGRVLGFSYQDVDRIAKLIPYGEGSLQDAINHVKELSDFYYSDEKIRQLLDVAKRLEGLSRHASIHAAGVVIADKPLTEYIPLYKTSDGEITTGYSMKPLEKLGLLKMDFLGLKTLTLIDTTLKIVKRTRKTDVDIKNLPPGDKKTYKMLSAGHSVGIFQLESSGMKDLLRKLRPEKFEDLIVCLALYRPGPIRARMLDDFIERKHGRQRVAYLHPSLESVLKETYGIIVYQEQVMHIASKLAGFSMAEADLLRRAMGKKDPEAMKEMREKFTDGSKKVGIKQDLADNIFSLMEHFAEYGFNKSHSAAYAMISYCTAYLKAHFPVEFMAALLTSEKDNQDKIMEYVHECTRMDIKILPPDINESFSDFTVTEDGNVRFGLTAVKNVGRAAVESIIDTRREEGKFEGFMDFCTRVDSRAVNKKVIESLIKCGAFDSLGFKRAQLASVLDKTISECARKQKMRNTNQLSLFGDASGATAEDNIPDVEEWPVLELLNFEKKLLGFFVTGHPLSKYEGMIKKIVTTDIASLFRLPDNQSVVLCGVLEIIKTTVTRKNEPMAILRLEDVSSQVEVFAFPRVYQEFLRNIVSGNLVVVKGRLTRKESMPKVISSSIVHIDEALNEATSLNLVIPNTEDVVLVELKKALSKFPGNTPVFLHFSQPELRLVKIRVKDQKVKLEQDLFSCLDSLLGEENFSLTL